LHLSFDDGPNPVHTPPLLELLAEHGARATFFLIGRHAEENRVLAQRIVDEGHVLGNHSYSHPHFERLSLQEQLDEVERAEQVLGTIDGRQRHAFRPPRGVLPPQLLLKFIRMRQLVEYWSYDSLDYSRRTAEDLIEQARLHPPRNGDIILMHDDNDVAIDMLRVLIPEWKAMGFALEALPPPAAAQH
jgi:peptidoglycan/xylan/chitin deacetylase (PgdA/CDA1 family)